MMETVRCDSCLDFPVYRTGRSLEAGLAVHLVALGRDEPFGLQPNAGPFRVDQPSVRIRLQQCMRFGGHRIVSAVSPMQPHGEPAQAILRAGRYQAATKRTFTKLVDEQTDE